MSKKENMEMVMQALKNAGLSDNQARILGAEIGRENSFNSNLLWGYHTDPKNRKTNIGIISWQGSRAKGVEKALKDAGLIENGRIVRGQASLDVMAKYLVNEIRTNPKYEKTKREFLDNPNVDYQTGNRVLGKNYILWRYDDANYAGGHKNRDNFYKELGGIVPKAGDSVNPSHSLAPDPMVQEGLSTTYQPPPMLAAQNKDLFTSPTLNLFGEGGMSLDLNTIMQGLAAEQSKAFPLLPSPYS